MKNQIVFVVEETDIVSELRALNYDIETRMAVVDRLFTNHKDDVDNSIFESVPYKQYTKELQNLYVAFDAAKDKFGKEIVMPIVEEKIGKSETSFDWNLDFQSLKVTVTV